MFLILLLPQISLLPSYLTLNSLTTVHSLLSWFHSPLLSPLIHHLLQFLQFLFLPLILSQIYRFYHLLIPYLPLCLPIDTLCNPDQRVAFLSQNQNCATKLLWIILLLNLCLIKLLLNTSSGVKLWMLSFKPYKGNRLDLWFLLLLMSILLVANGYSN